MKKSKKNYVMIALVVILLCLAVGYAAFSANLDINGTATGTGKWDVKFTSAKINEENHGDAPTVTDTDVTVNVKLAYPGDGCTVTANIINNGNVPAKLDSLGVFMPDGTTEFTSDDIVVTIPEIEGDKLEAGKTCPFTFAVQWKEGSEKSEVNAEFKIKFTYSQDTTAVTVTPNHGTHN